MKILHTADWHLGDRLGRQDRTADLERAVERIARYCDEDRIDVLLVAGDLFSEQARQETLRNSIEHLCEVFTPFLSRGGTIVAVTGNHDDEIFCQILHGMMNLAAPVAGTPGEMVRTGRLYLATNLSVIRLADRGGNQVQFVLMPYPTPGCYLDGQAGKWKSIEEKNQFLQAAYTRKLDGLLRGRGFDPSLPTVVAAHITVRGRTMPNLFRLNESEDVIFETADLPAGAAYVALGHIHQPQEVNGMMHVRYSGSIERLDLGEREDQKGVFVVDIGPDGLVAPPTKLLLDATPIYAVDIDRPEEQLPILRELYPDHDRALVRYRLTWTAGKDRREAILRELDRIFPRWYDREIIETSALRETETGAWFQANQRNFEETVREYLRAALVERPDEEQKAILLLAEEFLAAEQASPPPPPKPQRKRGRTRQDSFSPANKSKE